MKKKDLTGQKFGRLTVLHEASPYISPTGKSYPKWTCLCECGQETDVMQINLTLGRTQSCGCLKKERLADAVHKRKRDLTGQKFGRWTVIRKLDPRPRPNSNQKDTMWECQCECGTIKGVTQKSLVSGQSKSCGCYGLEVVRSQGIDITNQRFGKLLVVSRAETLGRGAMWNCLCDCGNTCVANGRALRSGKIKSCGCIFKDRYEKNQYDLSGEYGIGYTDNGVEFYFDKEDYDLIKSYRWVQNRDGYICSFPKHGEKAILMHRVVMNADKGQIVDHIQHNTTDNRKQFLRFVTPQQNIWNSQVNRNNTIGIKGIRYVDKTGHYAVSIMANGINHHIGTFDNINDAMQARIEAENQYHGQYSYYSSTYNTINTK